MAADVAYLDRDGNTYSTLLRQAKGYARAQYSRRDEKGLLWVVEPNGDAKSGDTVHTRWHSLETASEVTQKLKDACRVDTIEEIAQDHLTKHLKDLYYASFAGSFGAKASNEDRIARCSWEDGLLLCIFDGDSTSENAREKLPGLLKEAISSCIRTDHSVGTDKNVVQEAMRRAIVDFDVQIGKECLEAITPEMVHEKDHSVLSHLINNNEATRQKVLRAKHGCTALVAFVAASGQDVYIANVGDCRALLGVQDKVSGHCKAVRLTHDLNGGNVDEVRRVEKEHPDEKDLVVSSRLLGVIAVTSSLGDYWFKFKSAEYIRKVLGLVKPSFARWNRIVEALDRYKTPPYITAVPETHYLNLGEQLKNGRCYLILESDGVSGEAADELVVNLAGRHDVDVPLEDEDRRIWKYDVSTDSDLAMVVIRNILGGSDDTHVAKELTLEGEGSTDDISIQVLVFDTT